VFVLVVCLPADSGLRSLFRSFIVLLLFVPVIVVVVVRCCSHSSVVAVAFYVLGAVRCVLPLRMSFLFGLTVVSLNV